MNRMHGHAALLAAAITAHGLLLPGTVAARDVLDGQSLLPKSASTADCQRRGGGGAGAGRAAHAPPAGGSRNVRTSASPNINHSGGGGRNVNANANRNVNANVNRNNNVNVNRNVNVNVDNHYGYRDGWDNHPIATGMAIGTAAAVTAAVIGSVVYSVPPSCSTVVVNGISYSQCGSTWYQPRYVGTSVEYVVVNAP